MSNARSQLPTQSGNNGKIPDQTGSKSNINGDKNEAASKLQDSKGQVQATGGSTSGLHQYKPPEGTNNNKVCLCYTSLCINRIFVIIRVN